VSASDTNGKEEIAMIDKILFIKKLQMVDFIVYYLLKINILSTLKKVTQKSLSINIQWFHCNFYQYKELLI